MKRLYTIAFLTSAFAFVAAQDASAWINSRFGIGMNWSWQSGGNSHLWGMFHNGQPCGPDIMHQAVPVYPQSCCNCPQVQYVPVNVGNSCCNGAGGVGPMGGPGFGAGIGAPGFGAGIGVPGFGAGVGPMNAPNSQAFRINHANYR